MIKKGQGVWDEYTGVDENGQRQCTVRINKETSMITTSGYRDKAVRWLDKNQKQVEEPPVIIIIVR